MHDRILQELGLSEKEARVYLALLRYGMKSISFIAKKTHLNRGTSYVVLHSLLERGLAAKSVKKKVLCFGPLDPNNLMSLLEHQEEKIGQTRSRLSAIIPELAVLANPLAGAPAFEYFEGSAGVLTALEDTLSSEDKTLRAFLSVADLQEAVGYKELEEYTQRRIKEGYAFHAIRTRMKDEEAFSKNLLSRKYISNEDERRDVRYVSEDLAFPTTMYIYDNKVLIISSQEENFALLIRSKELSAMQRRLFELIWKGVKT